MRLRQRGCLEKHASATAIVGMARLMQLGDDLTSDGVYEMAAAGDEKAQQIFRDHGRSARNRPRDSDQYLQFPAVSAQRRTSWQPGTSSLQP